MTICTVTHLRSGLQLADAALVPQTPEERRTGLLNHARLSPGEGLVLLDCSRIHTIGMNVPIDVLFCDGKGRVKWAAKNCLPGNRSLGLNGTSFVVELPAGMIQFTGTIPGDVVQLEFHR